MGFFSFVENFFFISLGITFVLILLLVYHFKQRMSSVERKGETMFELMSSVVKEINVLKNVHSYYDHFFTKSSPPIDVPPADVLSYNIVDPVETMEIHNQQSALQPASQSASQKIVSLESESEEDESDLESENSESDSDDESSIDSDEDDDATVHADADVVDVTLATESDVFSNDTVRIHLEQVQDIPLEMEIDALPEEPARNSDSSLDFVKVDDVVQDSVNDQESDAADARPKDHYRRLNLQQLKATVQSLGLQVDVTKMKKNEIVRVLESASM